MKQIFEQMDKSIKELNEVLDKATAQNTGVYFDTEYKKFIDFKSKLASDGLSRKEFLNDMIDCYLKHGKDTLYKKLEIEKLPF